MSDRDSIGPARDGLLAVIAADREARCRAILDPEEAAAEARRAEGGRAVRQRLRRALRASIERERAGCAAARAQCEAALRVRHQRLLMLALDEGWPLLVAALERRWLVAATRRLWIDAALAAGLARLPRSGWRIRYAAGPTPGEISVLVAGLAASGVNDVGCEQASGIGAGIEIRVGDACLDATAAGLLADRSVVAGRLLALWEAAVPAAQESAP
ncbi:hypothetical protein LLG90_11435 [Aromatoleum toluclasticum]|uniref:hypothetical protein n=1 Tax=Aromatoleum toluclasticum TaxID=92003 RepID=UPI001D184B2B|nr:hypothetical protein [Aromatoleum toluclasticum]MCC4115961.1 hypothetical protein [Aromatoleum toluclasticum]